MPERSYVRKFMRIKPEGPVYAGISIVRICDKNVMTSSARVRIIDLCPGGLKFVSTLNMPVDKRVIVELDFGILEYTFRLRGHIVYKIGVEAGEYVYGLCFTERDDTLKSCLKKLFNNMCIRLDNHMVILKLN